MQNLRDTMPNPQLSILMSVWNAMPYLQQALDSILAQTFRDWELIIVDDASTDASFEYVKSIAQVEPRIVFLQNDRNLGPGGTANRGLALCRGKWVARMDADDIALSNRLETQVAFMTANEDVAATSCLAYYIDSTGKRVGKTIAEIDTRDKFQRTREQNLAIGLLHPGAFIKREVIQAIGGYRPEFGSADDIDLWCRISDNHLILAQPEYLMEYRVHNHSLSAQAYEQTRLRHLWARDSMIARRSGLPEPTWEMFIETRRSAPLGLRLNRWRKMQAKRLYRHSAQCYTSGLRLRSAFEIGLATMLQPTYTLRRLKGQFLR